MGGGGHDSLSLSVPAAFVVPKPFPISLSLCAFVAPAPDQNRMGHVTMVGLTFVYVVRYYAVKSW